MSEDKAAYDISQFGETQLRHECARLRAERDEAIKARDEWRCRHKLAVMAARNLCDELTAMRREREADLGPQRGPFSTGKIEAERRAAIRAMDRELST
jgi:hypothetical protein